MPLAQARRTLKPNGEAQFSEGTAWRRAWEHVIPFFAFAPEIRKMIDTTTAVEALNRSLRKIIETCGSSPTTRRR
ncbi:transposase [Bradyrhizobium sp. CCGUVB14]|uniref:transposase n=1 Tax=Bradyrhizobium sp. CCGUVB14 TaxID=2949628 RepID=UPI0020B29AEE|nr:transposase [Bradyrhizobium sp. CCGUVB14]MCP3440944.1 transposase [Bradyrhizobium sp. CCGUVB14]